MGCWYLAHSFDERAWVDDELVPELKKRGVEILNPFKNRVWLEELKYIDRGDPRYAQIIQSIPKETPGKIVQRDLDNIKKCDGLIVYVKNIRFGAAMETFYNSFVLGRGRSRTLVVLHEEIDSGEKETFEIFGRVIETYGDGPEDEAQKISEALAEPGAEYRDATLPEAFEKIKEYDGLAVELDGPNAEKAMKIFYNSSYLGRGREKTIIYLKGDGRKFKEHPWLKYLGTVVATEKDLEDATRKLNILRE